jgi:hypothetical protein
MLDISSTPNDALCDQSPLLPTDSAHVGTESTQEILELKV